MGVNTIQVDENVADPRSSIKICVGAQVTYTSSGNTSHLVIMEELSML